MSARGTNGAFDPANPKIDLYRNGEYLYSTCWYRTNRDALAALKAKHAGTDLEPDEARRGRK